MIILTKRYIRKLENRLITYERYNDLVFNSQNQEHLSKTESMQISMLKEYHKGICDGLRIAIQYTGLKNN